MSKNETIWIIAFDGSTSSWSDWEVKFLVRGQRKGFAGILKGTAKAPPALQVVDKKTPAGKIEKQNRDTNNYAYEEILLSIQTKTEEGRVAFHIVVGSMSTDLPDGEKRRHPWKPYRPWKQYWMNTTMMQELTHLTMALLRSQTTHQRQLPSMRQQRQLLSKHMCASYAK